MEGAKIHLLEGSIRHDPDLRRDKPRESETHTSSTVTFPDANIDFFEGYKQDRIYRPITEPDALRCLGCLLQRNPTK